MERDDEWDDNTTFERQEDTLGELMETYDQIQQVCYEKDKAENQEVKTEETYVLIGKADKLLEVLGQY